jgi:hypothetical protein
VNSTSCSIFDELWARKTLNSNQSFRVVDYSRNAMQPTQGKCKGKCFDWVKLSVKFINLYRSDLKRNRSYRVQRGSIIFI